LHLTPFLFLPHYVTSGVTLSCFYIDNLNCAVALHFMYYQTRIHKTLRVTPAMEAGVLDHVWSLEEIANLLY
jgi:hypothetical protein